MTFRWHFPVWKSMVAVAVFAVLLAVCIVPLGRIKEFDGLKKQMDATIRFLKPTHPGLTNPAVWDCAHELVINAYCNVCYTFKEVSIAEMYRLREDLDQKLKGEVNVDTLVWIWDRLGQTGPHGKDYAESLRSTLESCFPPPSTGPTAPVIPSNR